MAILTKIIQLLIQYLPKLLGMAGGAVPAAPKTPREALRKHYAENGAHWVEGGVNICGFRDTSNPNTWNDVFFICIGELTIKATGTTDPGKKYTFQPFKPEGAGNITNGFHSHLWEKGLHRGKPALRQAGAVKVWRDKDRDHEFDPDSDPVQIAGPECGFNFHRANRNHGSVGGWSAGCQVPHDDLLFAQYIKLINEHDQTYFDYLLSPMASMPVELKKMKLWKGLGT